MGYLSLIVILFIYYFIVLFYNKKENTKLVISLIVYYIFYDYLFLNIEQTIGTFVTTILKLFYEFIIILIYIKSTNGLKTNKYDTKFKLVLMCVCYGCIISVFSVFSFSNLLKGFRLYFEPWIASYILYKSKRFKNVNMHTISIALCVIVSILICFSVYQMETVSRLNQLWFFSKFSKINSNLYNSSFLYFRENQVRAPSFFDGPIAASLFYSYAACLFLTCIKCKMKNKIIFFVFMLVSLYGVYLSRTRIGFSVFFLFLIYISITKKSVLLQLLIPACAVFITFYSLIAGYYNEPSAYGRLIQYGNFFADFRMQGLGIADSDALVKYDSFFISFFLSIGFCTILFYTFIAFYLKKSSVFFKKKYNQNNVLIYYNYGITVVSVYIIAFQFYAGYAPYKFYALIFMMAYYDLNTKLNEGK